MSIRLRSVRPPTHRRVLGVALLAFVCAFSAAAQDTTAILPAPPEANAPQETVRLPDQPARLTYGFWLALSDGNVPGTVAWTIGRHPAIATAEARFPGLDLVVTVEILSPADGPLVVDVAWTGEFPNRISRLDDVVAQLDEDGYVNRALTGFEAVADTHFRLVDPRGQSWLNMDQLLGMEDLTLHFTEVGRAQSLIVLQGRGGTVAEPTGIPVERLDQARGPAFDLVGAIWPLVWAIVISIGFLVWRAVLGGSFATIGPWPLAVAYAMLIAVLFASSLVDAGMRLSQAPTGFFFAFTFALPAVTLTGVPLAAYFARVNDLNYGVAGILGIIVVLATVVLRAGVGLGADGWTFVELTLATAAFYTGMIAWMRWQQHRRARAAKHA